MVVHVLNDLSFLENELKESDVDQVKIDADKGIAEAQYILALMFDIGRGVKRNPREAEKWYKKAAEQNHGRALYYLARMYSTETSGIPKDEEKAKELFSKAAAQGFRVLVN